MEIVLKSVDLLCYTIDENTNFSNAQSTGELILYKRDDGQYQFEFIHIGFLSRIANSTIESMPAIESAAIGLAKKAGVAAGKIAMGMLTGGKVHHSVGREIGSDDLNIASKKMDELKQSNYNVDEKNFKRTKLTPFSINQIGKTMFIRPFAQGGSLSITRADHLCIYDKNKMQGFFITVPNGLAWNKWMKFFNLNSDIKQDFTSENFNDFRHVILFGEQEKNAHIKLVRRKKFKGGLRDYVVRIDGGKTYLLSNGSSFELQLEAGRHKIEIANKGVILSETNWSADNCLINDYYNFDSGDVLLLDMTMDEYKIQWK